MDIPRQHRPSAMRTVRRRLKYPIALFWTLTLGASANAVMFWIVDQLLSRPR